MNSVEFESFLDRIRASRKAPFTRKSELISYLDNITCEGCEKKCIPCGSCDTCESSDACQNICDKCSECGCQTHNGTLLYLSKRTGVRDGDNTSAGERWRQRYINTKVEIWKAMRGTDLSLRQLIQMFDRDFVKEICPYTTNKEMWRKHFLDMRRLEPCPPDVDYSSLNDDEKLFFEDPHKHISWNYNILNIMGGIPGQYYSL